MPDGPGTNIAGAAQLLGVVILASVAATYAWWAAVLVVLGFAGLVWFLVSE